MDTLRLSVAQFEPKDGEKNVNLTIMEDLIAEAKSEGAQVISFHELCTTGYTYLQNLTKDQIARLAEPIPDGWTTQRLIELAKEHDITVLAGILEEDSGHFYNSYVALNADGLIARHRKLHPFISQYLSAGDEFTTFDLHGWTAGILICYDNNVIENVRATTLLGAEIIFAPHVTGCTPSSMPGRGFVDHKFWEERDENPEALREEFRGPKHRGWLMRWLPARAYDNGVYYAFSNPIGYDGSHLKGGNAMILDPYGELLAETNSFEADIATASITRDKLQKAGGYRYRNARRPKLYGEIIGASHESDTTPYWMKNQEEKDQT